MCFTWLLIGTLLVSDVPITWDEVSSISHQNRAVASHLRVRWDLTKRHTEAEAKYYLSQAEVLDQRARSDEPGLSETSRSQMRKAAEANRKNYTTFSDRRETFRQDFWSDRDNFQIRKESMKTKELLKSFPDALATPDNLPTDFAHVSVLSYGLETKHLFRRWDAETNIGMGSGAVVKTHPDHLLFFPPFGYRYGNWPGRPLTIDRFWDEGADLSEVLGEVMLDQRKCVVVRRTWPPGKPTPDDQGGTIMIGWIDIDRGAIPLRIERYRRSANSKTEINPSDLAPSKLNRPPFPSIVVRNVKVAEAAPGFSYPQSGIEEELAPVEAAWDKPAKAFAPYVVYEWNATKINIDQEMPASNFSLLFPQQTVFINQPTNDIRVTTDAEGTAERLVQQARQQVTHPPSDRGWIYWGVILSCFSLLAVAYKFWARCSY